MRALLFNFACAVVPAQQLTLVRVVPSMAALDADRVEGLFPGDSNVDYARFLRISVELQYWRQCGGAKGDVVSQLIAERFKDLNSVRLDAKAAAPTTGGGAAHSGGASGAASSLANRRAKQTHASAGGGGSVGGNSSLGRRSGASKENKKSLRGGGTRDAVNQAANDAAVASAAPPSAAADTPLSDDAVVAPAPSGPRRQ